MATEPKMRNPQFSDDLDERLRAIMPTRRLRLWGACTERLEHVARWYLAQHEGNPEPSQDEETAPVEAGE